MDKRAQAARIMELIGQGFSMPEAIELALSEVHDKKVLEDRPYVWTMQGDLRCPVCGKYSTVWTHGYWDSTTIKIKCDKHGVFYKTPEKKYWRSEEQVEAEAETAATKQA